MLTAGISAAGGQARAIDRAWAVATLMLVASVTEAIFLLLPSFVGALADVLHFSEDRTGLLASADLAGIAVATATGPWWLRRVSWRRTVLGALAVFLIANVLCFGVGGFALLFSLRVLAGLSAGTAYAVALAGIVGTLRSDRNVGLLVCMQVVFGAAGVYVLDAVRIAWRLDAVYVYVLAWLIPTLALSYKFFPEDPGHRARIGALDWGRLAGPGAAVVGGAGLYFLMIGAVWGYLEGIAREAGLTLQQTGAALSIGLLVSLLGSGVAAWTGLRYGRALPLIVTAVFQVLSLYLLTRLGHYSDVVLAFYVFNTVFQIFWSYIIAYFIIIFNDVDPSGRFVTLYGMITHLTLALGPYVGAFLIRDGRHVALLWFGIAAVVLCYACFLAAVWLNRARPTVARIEARV
jgi:MFS transporter, DHA1 family, inner membrane transport protein